MSTTVGAIDVKITGSATGAVAATNATSAGLDKAAREAASLAEALKSAGLVSDATGSSLAGTTAKARALGSALGTTTTATVAATGAKKAATAAIAPLSAQANKAAESVGKMRGSIAGLSSIMGSASPQINMVTGAVQQMIAGFAVGGGVGAVVTAVGVAIAFMVSKLGETDEAHRVAMKAARDHSDAMGTLQAKIDAVGKSASATAKIIQGAEAAKSVNAYLSSDEGQESLKRENELTADVNRTDAALAKGTANPAAHLRFIAEAEKEINKIRADRAAVMNRINGIYAKEVEFAEKTERLEKSKAAAAKAAADAKKIPKELTTTMAHAGILGVGPLSTGFGNMDTTQGSSLQMLQMISGMTDMAAASEHAAGSIYLFADESLDAVAKMAEASEHAAGLFPPDVLAGIAKMAEQTDLAGEDMEGFRASAASWASALDKAADQITKHGNAVLSGSGMSSVGAELGNVIGSSIYGAIGGAIGGLIGSVLGDLGDELFNMVGVLEPIFAGLALVVGGLQPFFVVMREMFIALMPVWAQLGVFVLQISRIMAAWMTPLIRIIQILALVISAFMTLINMIFQFASVLVSIAYMLDMAVGQRIVFTLTTFANTVIQANNTLVDLVRSLTGLKEFGIKMATLSTEGGSVIEMFDQDFLASFFDEIGLVEATEDNTAATEELARAYTFSTTNIPASYRVGLSAHQVENPAQMALNGGLNYNGLFSGATVNLYASTTSGIVEDARRAGRRQGRGLGSPGGGNGGGN